jgi:predicted branched-subunit amino acid permease
MQDATAKTVFWTGFRDGSPFIVVVAPFGLLFGVVSIDSGLNLVETLAMTFLVVAGAAQFTALSLLKEQAPTFIVILTALAVNLRMAMYSAALVPHLGKARLGLRAVLAYFMVDQAFAVAFNKYEQSPDMPIWHKVVYYFGSVIPIVVLWFTFSITGALLGRAIPAEFSLDFAIPICFIALVAPALRSVPHFVAAGVSILAALALAWVPYSLGLIVAAAVAMLAGAETERRLAARKAP